MEFLDLAITAMEDLGDHLFAQAELMEEFMDGFTGLVECGVVDSERVIKVNYLLGMLKELSLRANEEIAAVHAEVSEKNKHAKLLS